MQQLRYRNVIGPNSENHWAQVVVNTDHTVLCSLLLVGETAQVLGEQLVSLIQTWQIHSALEFHQLLQDLIIQVGQKNQLFLSAGGFLEGKCFLATYQGSVVLRRHHKAGVLVVSEQTLQLIEGKTQPEDMFIFATQAGATALERIWQPLNQDLPADEVIDLLHTQLPLNAQPSEVVLAFLTQIQEVSPEKESSSEDSEQTKPATVLTQGLQNLPQKIKAAPAVFQRLKSSVIKLQYWLDQQRQIYFSGDIYLRRQNNKKLIRIFLPIATVIILLVAGMVVYRSRISAQVAAADKALAPFQTKLSDLKSLNKENPLEARAQAEQLVTQLQDVAQRFNGQSAASKKVQTTLSEAQSFYQSISGKEEFPALPVFFDLKPTQSDFITSDGDLQNSVAVLLDQGQKKLIALNLQTKQPTLISAADSLNPTALSFDGKAVSVLSNGIAQFPLGDPQKVKQLRDSEDANQNAKFLASFGDYFYVLNPGKRNIFRYVGSASSSAELSDPAGWLKQGSDLDLEMANSMAIDGNIWLGFKDGQLKKLLSGKIEDFSIAGLKDPFSSPITLYTKEDMDNLYILEPQKSRVVVLNKKGEFVKEVKSQSLSSATVLFADEKQKKIFAVSGSLIFEMPL